MKKHGDDEIIKKIDKIRKDFSAWFTSLKIMAMFQKII